MPALLPMVTKLVCVILQPHHSHIPLQLVLFFNPFLEVVFSHLDL